MAKILNLPPIPGVRDLQTLMAFIMNKEEYDARLEAMVTLQDEIHSMIGKYSKVKDLDALLSSAMQKDAEASTTLENARLKAKAEALDILSQAKDKVAAQVVEVEKQKAEVVEKMAQLMTAKEDFEFSKAEVEADLKQRLEACDAREKESMKVKGEVEGLQELLNAKLAKLKAATEGV